MPGGVNPASKCSSHDLTKVADALVLVPLGAGFQVVNTDNRFMLHGIASRASICANPLLRMIVSLTKSPLASGYNIHTTAHSPSPSSLLGPT